MIRRILCSALLLSAISVSAAKPWDTTKSGPKKIPLNQKADGYRGIWCAWPGGPKYGGGLGTYCAKHRPFAVYCAKVRKTFFCYGGTTKDSNKQLLHMVGYYDHKRKVVPRPTILLDKSTSDPHDNPVISVDAKGYIWIFSTSHGRMRPSYVHRSTKPYNIDTFERIAATRIKNGRAVPLSNFSYFQVWHEKQGFIAFFTQYNNPVDRTLFFMSSRDGKSWSAWTRLAAFGKGHYQISAARDGKVCSAFNYHPPKGGLDRRTNLYYIESADHGRTWQTAAGRKLELPVKAIDSPALVHDFIKTKHNVYLKDIRLDADGRPLILVVTSGGPQPTKTNDPRRWQLFRWTGKTWDLTTVTTSDHNYDMGSLYFEKDGIRLVAPTISGPQAYATGGEMAMWQSRGGTSWKKLRTLTVGSERNHTYARRPVHAHPDFYAYWADGNGVKESISNLYFCNRDGDVFALPRTMQDDFAKPVKLGPKE